MNEEITCPYCKDSNQFKVVARGRLWHVFCTECNAVIMDVWQENIIPLLWKQYSPVPAE